MGRYFDKDKFGKRLLELMADNNDTTYSCSIEAIYPRLRHKK